MSQQWNIEFRSSYTRKRTTAQVSAGRDCVLGSDSGNEVVLEGQDVQPQHARIAIAENRPAIQPIDKASVSLNGQPISAVTHLSDGDWLGLGATLFQVRFLEDDLSEPTVPTTKGSTPFAGAHEQPPSPPERDTLIIGRLPTCDLAIASPLVSREHARLLCDPSGVTLEDLRSTNGTFINGSG